MRRADANDRPRGRASPLLAGAVGALAALVFAEGGCQAIVGDAIPTFTCSGTATGTCPVGQFCKGSGCVPCELRDACDGFDNDCNGKADDGDLSDRDGDGFTFCGGVDATSGKLIFDCDDNDPEIHPDAQERCNGKDDDCDRIVDNPERVCPENETCAPKAMRCLDSASLCSAQNCVAPKVCDLETQQCVTPNAAKPGEPCAANRACETGICGDASTLGKAVVDISGNICTLACCSSSECPRESLCYATGGGGNYCVPKSALKITTALGTKAAGDMCQSDTDCRSGSCEPIEKRCIDTCCVDSNCKSGTLCRLATSFRGKTSFACQAGTGTREQNDTCSVNADCRSGYCNNYGFALRYCVMPCCGSARCGTVNFGFGVLQDLSCRNAPVGTQGDVASLCNGERQGAGIAPVGAPCTADSTCASELCLTLPDSSRKCTDVCCTDFDCASAGWVCRPTSVQNKLYLRCVPK